MSRSNQKNSVGSVLLLGLAALIWGFAFVSQSVGAEYVDALTFQASRNWLAVIVLFPVVLAADRIREKKGLPAGKPANAKERGYMWLGGVCCGTALFAASLVQQVGIGMTTTAKAGFITALYVVLVPIISIFLGKMPGQRIWICVVLSVAGLYFLCMTGGLSAINLGDILVLICAFLFSIQILCINHFVKRIDGIRLSLLEMLTTAVLSTVGMMIFGHPTYESLRAALIPIAYAGIMSSGVAYTLQIVGQGGCDPTVASLIMCLESVFSAIGGWLILGQKLSYVELFGCALMFGAIVLSQLPERESLKSAEQKRKFT